MSNKDILLLAKTLSDAKGVKEESIFEAIEAALAAVAAKRYDDEVAMRVAIDRQTGDYETFRYWTVVDEAEAPFEFPDQVLTLSQAHEVDPDLSIGDVVEEAVDNAEFGRISAQQAKQIILQKVRDAERDKVVKQYTDQVGELLLGLVKRVTREFVILEMGGTAEALLLREDMIPREAFRANDRVRVYLYEVREEQRRGPQLLVSRKHPELLINLFKIEVPEIGEDVIEIKAAARDAGSRAKVAVKTNDGRIDPIGACVGMRGSRVQAVSNELGGERIDVILWDDNPAQLVINAMAPAEVASIVVDEDSHTMDIAVSQDQLSQAIGRSGQNVRLASELSGWNLNVMSEKDAVEKTETETKEVRQLFVDSLDVDEDIAEVLVNEGFTSLEQLSYIPLEELQEIDGFDADIAEELQSRAADYLLTQEIATAEEVNSVNPAEDLLSLEGMTEALACQLARNGIVTREDLAEQSVDDVLDIVNEMDPDAVAKLIMAARAHWFE